MNKVSFVKLILLLLISGFLSGCKPQFPSVEKAYVIPQTNTQYRFTEISSLALSPDGQNLVLEDLTQVQLATGSGSHPFNNYKFPPSEIIHSGPLAWSPDGQYLAATYFNDDRIHPGANRRPIYIYDPENRTVFRANELASGFQHWSPFNTGNYFAGNLSTGDWGVFNITNAEVIPLDKSIDFREEKEFRATDDYLWSKELDIPVAVLSTLPIMDENGEKTDQRQAAIISFSNQVDYENPDYYVPIPTVPTNNLIDFIFDPTGTFILTLQLECYNDIQIQCSKDGFFSTIDPNNVSDSILTIVDWKTGEQKELYRLSWIDSQNVVASLWSLSWSADGNTILLGRKDSSPVVLRLSYP